MCNFNCFSISKKIAVLFLCIYNLNLTCGALSKSVSNNFFSEIDPKIIGGLPIAISQAPWQVSVRLKAYEQNGFGSGFICGGSVISQRVILTAAHCVANTAYTPIVYRLPSEFTVVMGSVYLYDVTQYTLQYNVQQIIVNSAFNIETLVNDAALFLINGYIPQNWPTVAPISLNNISIANGTQCTVSGWGKTSSGYVSSILMGATVPIVSNTICSTNYGNLSQGMLCAGYMLTGGVDACQGDSGGPLQCNGVLAGIVSWGDGCAQVGYPGVYTNVSYYNQWITFSNSTLDYSYYAPGGAARIFKQQALFDVFVAFVALVWFHFKLSG